MVILAVGLPSSNSYDYEIRIGHKDEYTIYSFDLDKKMWDSEYLNTGKNLGELESLIPSSGFLHLSGRKFCLMLKSTDDKSHQYLYFFVLDLSVKSHLSVLSIQKYLLDSK